MFRIFIASQFLLAAIMLPRPALSDDGIGSSAELAQHIDGHGGKGAGRKRESGYGREWRYKAPDPNSFASKLPLINVHVHIDPTRGQGKNSVNAWDIAVEIALKEMDEYGIKLAILMPPPGDKSKLNTTTGKDYSYDYTDLLNVAKNHPGRFAVLGGGVIFNPVIENYSGDNTLSDDVRLDFEEKVKKLTRRGALGIGELAALHRSANERYPFEDNPPDHPMFLLLADLAARHDIPLDIHMEAVDGVAPMPEYWKSKSSNFPDFLVGNIKRFERLLAHNRQAKIIWTHLGWDSIGQRTAALTRRLLKEHSNLYFSIKIAQQTVRGNMMVKRRSELDPQWRNVIAEFPNRFMIGTDGFYLATPRFGRSSLRTDPVGERIVLNGLPPAVARKVAFENAQRLFKIKVIDPKDYPLPAATVVQ